MYLMDTCAFLWFLEDNEALSKDAKKAMEESEHLYLSIASLWEIAIKKSIHKLKIEKSITELERICYDLQITILPIKPQYLERIQRLPMIHGDPFDRLMISTALEENLELITQDAKIAQYGIKVCR